MYASGGLKGQMKAIVLLTDLLCQDSKSHVEIKGAEVCNAIGGQASRALFCDSRGDVLWNPRERIFENFRENFWREFLREFLREFSREFSR